MDAEQTAFLAYAAALAEAVNWRATVPWWHWCGNLAAACMLAWNVWELVSMVRRNRSKLAALMGPQYPTLYWFYAGAEALFGLTLLMTILIEASSPIVAALRLLAAAGYCHTNIVLRRSNVASEQHWRGSAFANGVRVAFARSVQRHAEATAEFAAAARAITEARDEPRGES